MPSELESRDIDAADIEVQLSWRDGNLIFRGESLEQAISEVSRYTEVRFVFLDEASKQQPVGGMFKAGDVEGLLSTLLANFNISYERRANNEIALRSND